MQHNKQMRSSIVTRKAARAARDQEMPHRKAMSRQAHRANRRNAEMRLRKLVVSVNSCDEAEDACGNFVIEPVKIVG